MPLSGRIIQNMASLYNLISLLSLITLATMGVVRLHLIILLKIAHIHVVFKIFNEQMLLKLSIILNHLALRAYFLSFDRFMNYSG